MRPRVLSAAVAGALLLGCASGSAGPAANVTPVSPTNGVLRMRAFEWRFDPPAIVLHRGERVQFTFKNDGTIVHDVLIPDLAAKGVASESNGPLSGDAGELFVGSEAGHEGTLTFVPSEVGTYTFYCTVSGHRQLGMVGRLTVE